jgi:hypothetical protein
VGEWRAWVVHQPWKRAGVLKILARNHWRVQAPALPDPGGGSWSVLVAVPPAGQSEEEIAMVDVKVRAWLA